jgi:Capsule assembly protein Wzi
LQLQAGARAQWRAGEDGARLGVRANGSAASLAAGPVVIQAWSRNTWWGPGWQSSLILGNNAPTLTGLGVQRASAERSSSPWLSWLGPWNFEFFMAQLEDVGQPAHPYLMGNRVTFKPLSGLEIGLTRTAQWGGRGRDQSLRSFLDLLSGAGLNATAEDAIEGNDPANALAGFDLRARCPSAWRCSGYLQLIGEDQAGLLPSRYLGLYGLEGWSADGRTRWFAELAETGSRMPIGQSGLKGYAYRNYAYPEGYVSAGRWLGASFGPDSRVLTLGWMDAAQGWTVRAHAGRIGSRAGSFSPNTDDAATSGQLIGLSAQLSRRWGELLVEPELSWYRVSADQGADVEARAGVALRWGGAR